LPGLILDRYLILKEDVPHQVFSFQLLTSGMDLTFQSNNNWETIFKSLVANSIKEGFSKIDWDHTLILQRNDVNIRKLEGIPIEEPKILKTVAGDELTDVQILVQNVLKAEEAISFSVNLVEGQKTGFFLDQTFNMRLLLEHLANQKDYLRTKKIRILDLCCYMGQWSAQIVANLKAWGVDCEVHLVDVSEMALLKAKQNVEKYKVSVVTHKKDVLNLSEMTETDFDIVISDPPAFVKNKKDIHQGLHAYFKLNAQAFKMCAPGAVVVSCTCSGLVQMDDFKEALRKSILRSGKNSRCVAFGGQGWDHPTLMSFPEGFYLKMVMHQLD
jgi:23S rRNA (cytosine1962-C5)-methyltransferase